MKPTFAALLLGVAVLGKCDDQGTGTSTEYVSSKVPPTTIDVTTTAYALAKSTATDVSPTSTSSHIYATLESQSSRSTSYQSATSAQVTNGPTGSTATGNPSTRSHYAAPVYTTHTEATAPASDRTSNGTRTLSPWETPHAGPTVVVDEDTREQIEDELTGEIEFDKNGSRVDIAFGLERALTIMNIAPEAKWLWSRLPEQGKPITDSASWFSDTQCTGGTIDPYEEQRASRNLHHFCNRWKMPWEHMYLSTSSKTTIYMCTWGSDRNCSLDLWEAASAHLDRECGAGATGYVHLQKLRLGRERPTEDVVFCPRLKWAPLYDYRINQREAFVDGRLYEEWRILNRRKQLRLELGPHDVNAGNDAEP